jgi:hypothetical protein
MEEAVQQQQGEVVLNVAGEMLGKTVVEREVIFTSL